MPVVSEVMSTVADAILNSIRAGGYYVSEESHVNGLSGHVVCHRRNCREFHAPHHEETLDFAFAD